jgi:predicted nuclease with TOPRIM domain
MSKKKPEKEIEDDVTQAITLAHELAALEQELMVADERFRKFIEKQQTFKKQSEELFNQIEEKMVEYGIKTVKGEWGAISLVERTYFTIDEDSLPRGYKKLVPDTKKIGDHYKLTGEAIKGAEPKTKHHLQKRFK